MNISLLYKGKIILAVVIIQSQHLIDVLVKVKMNQ